MTSPAVAAPSSPRTAGAPPYRPDIAVVLVNLGTPEAPTPGAVRRWLREFLWDRRVVEMPRPLWWLILNLLVLPLRPRRVAKLYASIWTPQGSPLRVITEALAARVQASLADPRIRVHAAMTYGEPALAPLLWKLEADGVNRVLVLPLYPQFSATTSGAVVDIVARYLLATRRAPDIRIVRDYCEHPAYVAALADSIRTFRDTHGTADRLLFSFHGIPQACVDKGDPYPHCCEATVSALVAQLGLAPGSWQLAYQSRFGAQQWLVPYTDETLKSWPSTGVKSVQVVCPGFAADCLETLEEVAEQNREAFLHAGGERYAYIPALNDSRAHAACIAAVVRDHAAGW
ncbi:MAG: ferrochelatase [Pseudomonadota bacterium]